MVRGRIRQLAAYIGQYIWIWFPPMRMYLKDTLICTFGTSEVHHLCLSNFPKRLCSSWYDKSCLCILTLGIFTLFLLSSFLSALCSPPKYHDNRQKCEQAFSNKTSKWKLIPNISTKLWHLHTWLILLIVFHRKVNCVRVTNICEGRMCV